MKQSVHTNWIRPATLAAVVTLLVPISSRAHDYWFAQEPSAVEVGDTCVLRLLVGDELQAELERPFQRELTTRFEWLTADESVNLLDRTPESAQPVLERKVTREGTALVVMDRSFVLTEGTYERFVEFLEHEDAVDLAPLVRVGDAGDQRLHDRRVGQELEILLLDDPWSVKPGAQLTVQMLFRGEPVKGLPIKSLVETGDGSVAVLKARTDANGKAAFSLANRGGWMIRATLIRPSEDREAADWDTHYATYSFRLPAPAER
jgi:hypothetical protein